MKPKQSETDFRRGFVCAVACYVQMNGAGTWAKALLGCAGTRHAVLRDGAAEDLETLRKAALLPRPPAVNGMPVKRPAAKARR